MSAKCLTPGDVIGVLESASKTYVSVKAMCEEIEQVTLRNYTRRCKKLVQLIKDLDDCKNCLMVVRYVLQDARRWIFRWGNREVTRVKKAPEPYMPENTTRELRLLPLGELVDYEREALMAIGMLSGLRVEAAELIRRKTSHVQMPVEYLLWRGQDAVEVPRAGLLASGRVRQSRRTRRASP